MLVALAGCPAPHGAPPDAATPAKADPAAEPRRRPPPRAWADRRDPPTPPEAMKRVDEGGFWMGADDGEEDERPRRRVELGAFLIDPREVTVAQYRACAVLGRCPPPVGKVGADDEPATGVSWQGAVRYCRAAGKRLPTEAEWEKAARGGDGRIYPWGNDFDCARGNFANYRGEGRCPSSPGRPVAVGSYPRGAAPCGALDMAGNVMEWVADRYDPDHYRRAPKRDPRGPEAGKGEEKRVVRGGGCCSMFGLPRASNRMAFPPSYTDDDIGFRCARDAAAGGAKRANRRRLHAAPDMK